MSQAGIRELRAGARIADRYVVERPLAEGGMGSVYLARDTRSGAHVAIKSLYAHYLANDVVRARFIDEGRIQMVLRHPNIVRVYEIAERPTLAFVMEYVEGPTLEDYLRERGPLPIDEILDITIPLLSGLGLAHARGIIHRDLKPSNILLSRAPTGSAWRPKIMDFGVAKLSRPEELTMTGTTVGTLHYMSPEQIVGSKEIDGRADIYSVGITLYKLCVGEVPFNASTEFALMMAQVESAPVAPTKKRADVDAGLEAIILRCLQKAPEARFQSVKEITAALLALRARRQQRAAGRDEPILLGYAMMADQVAVDRTEEIVLATRALYQRGSSLSYDPREVREDDTALRREFQSNTRMIVDPDASDATFEVDPRYIEELRQADHLTSDDADVTTTWEQDAIERLERPDTDPRRPRPGPRRPVSAPRSRPPARPASAPPADKAPDWIQAKDAFHEQIGASSWHHAAPTRPELATESVEHARRPPLRTTSHEDLNAALARAASKRRWVYTIMIVVAAFVVVTILFVATLI